MENSTTEKPNKFIVKLIESLTKNEIKLKKKKIYNKNLETHNKNSKKKEKYEEKKSTKININVYKHIHTTTISF